jgi:hypothetical protein
VGSRANSARDKTTDIDLQRIRIEPDTVITHLQKAWPERREFLAQDDQQLA